MTDDHVTSPPATWSRPGRNAADLPEAELLQELEQVHSARHQTFLHSPTQALVAHSERQHELEEEYLRRHPDRDVDPGHLVR